jgi:hypothetical protein
VTSEIEGEMMATEPYQNLAIAVLCAAVKAAEQGKQEAIEFISKDSWLLTHWCHVAELNEELFRGKARKYLDGLRRKVA